MPMPFGTVNRRAMLHQLTCAVQDISSIIAEVARGKNDDCESYDFGVTLSVLLDHLCLTWHEKWMSDEDIDRMVDDSVHARMSISVPNWGKFFRLVNMCSFKEMDMRGKTIPAATINRGIVTCHLNRMANEIERICEEISGRRLEKLACFDMSCGFVPIMKEFCLAWHLKWLNDEGIKCISSTKQTQLESSIPDIGVASRILVDINALAEYDMRNAIPGSHEEEQEEE